MARYYRRRYRNYYNRARGGVRRVYVRTRSFLGRNKVVTWLIIAFAIIGLAFLFIPNLATWVKSKLGLKTA